MIMLIKNVHINAVQIAIMILNYFIVLNAKNNLMKVVFHAKLLDVFNVKIAI